MSFFFQIFMKNPLLSCPYLVKKKVTSVKTALQYKPKKSKGCPFFSPDFSRKKSLLSCPYFVKKTSILSKTLVLSYHFFNFFIKNPSLIPIFGQKNVNFINTTHYGPKKSISQKNQCSHARLWSTNFHSLKKTLLPFPYFVKKTSILSKT